MNKNESLIPSQHYHNKTKSTKKNTKKKTVMWKIMIVGVELLKQTFQISLYLY